MSLLVCSGAFGQESVWPIKGKIDLSSSFCEYRSLHFHGGIDIRTGGTEGRRIYSPVDGYVWRIKYSYIGSGKGLYLKDSQGFIYVFFHLSRLSDRFEKIVKQIQYEDRRYYLERFFEVDSIPVEKGELIAYSGQTGYGTPHIHFEKRNPSNMPLNPLTNGFAVEDNMAPEFKVVGLIYQDSNSVFANGKRRLYLKPEYDRGRNRYFLEPTIPVKAPFGITVNALDRIRTRGVELNIYRARLFIDDYLRYEVEYESYDYAQTAMVDLSYDYQLIIENGQHWHLLFKPPGKEFDGSKSLFESGGIFTGRTNFSYGLHHCRIEIFDAAGNMSELVFDFVLAPPGDLFEVQWLSDSVLYLVSQPDNRYMDIREVEVYGTRGRDRWRRIDSSRIYTNEIGDLQVTLPAQSEKLKALRIDVIGESGWRISDHYITLVDRPRFKYKFDYFLVGGGILFEIRSVKEYAPPPRIDIVHEDGYVRKIEAVSVAADRFSAFYRNEQINSRIIRMEVCDNRDDLVSESKEVEIVPAGMGLDEKIIAVSNDFEMNFVASCFYSPAMIEVVRPKRRLPKLAEMVTAPYSVSPISVPLAQEIDISFRINPDADRSRIGVYRLNKKDIWKWRDSEISGDRISATSDMMGTFAVIEDKQSPRVKKIYPRDGKTVRTVWPEISCTITEDLSGIENDSNITVLLDGRWLIPEYDPETERLKTSPDRALSNGRHELVIKVSDRAGNSRTVYSHFYVRKE